MKLSLNLIKPQKKIIVSKDLPVKVQNVINKLQGKKEVTSIIQSGKNFVFAPHYSQSGKIDCILANYGAYTRTVALDAEEDNVFDVICDLVQEDRVNKFC